MTTTVATKRFWTLQKHKETPTVKRPPMRNKDVKEVDLWACGADMDKQQQSMYYYIIIIVQFPTVQQYISFFLCLAVKAALLAFLYFA